MMFGKRNEDAINAMMERDRQIYEQEKEMLEKMRPKEMLKSAEERVLLGCQTTGQCFCTGRCKRTAEEQAAHEALIAQPFVLGRDVFEPKPGHGPAPTPEQERADNIAFMDAIANHPSALNTQVGGDHYKTMGEFQPWSVLQAWLTPEEFRGYMKGTAIAYLARERQKGGDQDVSKATHTLQGLIEMLAGGAE